MKRILYIAILFFTALLTCVSCLMEDNVKNPVVDDVKFFMTNADLKDSLITQIFNDNQIKISIYTDADLVIIWPGAIRTVMKKKENGKTDIDSLDMFNHPVLVRSDDFTDYGLVGAKGVATSLGDDGGWYAWYTYPSPGDFTLTVVATNHGYDSPDLKRAIFTKTVTVNKKP